MLTNYLAKYWKQSATRMFLCVLISSYSILLAKSKKLEQEAIIEELTSKEKLLRKEVI